MFVLITNILISQNIAITDDGNYTAHNSAMLDVKSLDKGLLIPRLTAAQRDAIINPATGLLVFVTDDNQFYYYGYTSWIPLAGGGDDDWTISGNYVYNISDSIGIGTYSPGALLDVGGHIWQTSTGKSVFLGEQAGAYDDLSDNRNVFIGNQAGYYNISGYNNAAYGSRSLYKNTSGHSNVAIGTKTLFENIDRSNLVAIGDSALYNNGTGVTHIWEGIQNTAIGSKALYSNTTGYQNTAIGYQALYSNTTGSNNTAEGHQALYSNTTGVHNTSNGYRALYSNETGSYNTANGSQSLYHNLTSDNNSVIGYQALYSNDTGSFNTTNGSQALYHNTTGHSNVAIGAKALYNNTSRNHLVAIGDSALYNNGTGAVLWYDATRNTANGSKALYSNTTGHNNTASGSLALSDNTTGYKNTANGCRALYWNETGIRNTAVGYWSGPWFSNLDNTGAFGYSAVTTADNQVRIGDEFVTSIGGYANWTNLSDIRFKTDISDNVPGLEFIKKLHPVTYHLDVDKINDFLGIPDSMRNDEFSIRSAQKKTAVIQTGFIAQEVEEAARSIGYDFSGVDAPKNEHDFYGLRYAEFVVPLVKAVQELQAIIEQQQVEIENLKIEIQRRPLMHE